MDAQKTRHQAEAESLRQDSQRLQQEARRLEAGHAELQRQSQLTLQQQQHSHQQSTLAHENRFQQLQREHQAELERLRSAPPPEPASVEFGTDAMAVDIGTDAYPLWATT